MIKKLGNLVISVLGGLLLIYSATRSYNFIALTLPADSQILAFFGLAALDGGLIAWLLSYLHGSRGAWQRGISLIMIIVDVIGAIVFFSLDTLYQTGVNGLTVSLTSAGIQTAVLGLSGVIGLNIVASVAHHIFEPERMKEAAELEAFDIVDDLIIKKISANAEQLAAQVAPLLAADWQEKTRARYMAGDKKILPPGVLVSPNGHKKEGDINPLG